ncbi:hypothetical protein CRENBAI_012120 [Crenichthys baileyi]|uniref:Uncharacterized protein n=1 Tax=Crenichthys baileyi TaxID=28760 RepID=A0AAV9SIJ0_9TELE
MHHCCRLIFHQTTRSVQHLPSTMDATVLQTGEGSEVRNDSRGKRICEAAGKVGENEFGEKERVLSCLYSAVKKVCPPKQISSVSLSYLNILGHQTNFNIRQ